MTTTPHHAFMERLTATNLGLLLARLGWIDTTDPVLEEVPGTTTTIQVRERRSDRTFLIKNEDGT